MRPPFIHLAQKLRKNMTDAEGLLWQHLKNKQLYGLRFRRQHAIGFYIVDFICLSENLVVEIDVSQHAEEENKKYDKRRDKWLKGQGFAVLRFWNNEVLENIEGVCDEIIWTVLNATENDL